MKPAEGSTVIGKSVSIRGELSGSEDLMIDGDIEGTITLPENSLTIGPNARIVADIKVRNLIVFGNVKGTLHVSGRVDLRHSAVVNGDIFGGRLSIEENAMLKGKVELKSERTVEVLPPVAKHAEAKAEQTPLVLEPKS
ncbi:bactofilin family protein [Edaphobacter flagellatus]|uniref:bactofilin family protein n=1 Tax=Edaphobacter flagellatus TaxID=1933044 RepID=UPI0021B42CF8|nr:polymer-forming cytoskeletal protein [Edaphobacter flagellatus]